MEVREKLVALQLQADIADNVSENTTQHREFIADFMMANGVTFATDTNDGGKWIPVKDRLPEVSGQYIVCCDDSACSYGEGIWYQSGVVVCADVDVGIVGGICWEWREGSTIYDLDGVITHWMPLPNPPI